MPESSPTRQSACKCKNLILYLVAQILWRSGLPTLVGPTNPAYRMLHKLNRRTTVVPSPGAAQMAHDVQHLVEAISPVVRRVARTAEWSHLDECNQQDLLAGISCKYRPALLRGAGGWFQSLKPAKEFQELTCQINKGKHTMQAGLAAVVLVTIDLGACHPHCNSDDTCIPAEQLQCNRKAADCIASCQPGSS